MYTYRNMAALVLIGISTVDDGEAADRITVSAGK